MARWCSCSHSCLTVRYHLYNMSHRDKRSKSRENPTYANPNANNETHNSTINRHEKTSPQMANTSRTLSSFNEGPVSQVYSLIKMSAKMERRSREMRVRIASMVREARLVLVVCWFVFQSFSNVRESTNLETVDIAEVTMKSKLHCSFSDVKHLDVLDHR